MLAGLPPVILLVGVMTQENQNTAFAVVSQKGLTTLILLVGVMTQENQNTAKAVFVFLFSDYLQKQAFDVAIK